MSPWVAWIHNVSFFHAAYEALAVNELRYLQLKEHKVWSLTQSRVVLSLICFDCLVRCGPGYPRSRDPVDIWIQVSGENLL